MIFFRFLYKSLRRTSLLNPSDVRSESIRVLPRFRIQWFLFESMELVTEDRLYLFFYGFVYFLLVYLCVQNFVKQRTFLKNNKKGVVLIISKQTEERC